MLAEKPSILSKKGGAQKGASEGKFAVRVIAGLVGLFAVVGAFAIAPNTQTENVDVRTVVENLPASIETPAAAVHDYWRETRIERGDTLSSMLARMEVNPEDAAAVLESLNGTDALQQLKPGRVIEANTSSSGELLLLRYMQPDGQMLEAQKSPDGSYATREHSPALETHVEMKSSRINSSLFGATDAVNLPDSIAIALADIFSGDIDFHKDIRKGDRFTVIYESMYHNGERIKTGRILAAEFVNNGKSYRAIYFQTADGHSGYYTPSGENLRKAFLKSPLEFSRISSGFTLARFHPIMKTWRAHKGVDYAAPTGTKVKATADGVVDFVGQQHGYGNLIVLRHSGNYSTAYGHLSRFAAGLHRGERVNQGDVIGYVGMTGMATGPHLHYEFRIAGVQHDPLSTAMPVAIPLSPSIRQHFMTASQPLVARLDMVNQLNVASIQ